MGVLSINLDQKVTEIFCKKLPISNLLDYLPKELENIILLEELETHIARIVVDLSSFLRFLELISDSEDIL